MVTGGSIEALAREHWTKAAHISVTPAGTGHVGSTGPDPKGFRLIVSDADGQLIQMFNTETLEEMDAKVRRLIESEETHDPRS